MSEGIFIIDKFNLNLCDVLAGGCWGGYEVIDFYANKWIFFFVNFSRLQGKMFFFYIIKTLSETVVNN